MNLAFCELAMSCCALAVCKSLTITGTLGTLQQDSPARFYGLQWSQLQLPSRKETRERGWLFTTRNSRQTTTAEVWSLRKTRTTRAFQRKESSQCHMSQLERHRLWVRHHRQMISCAKMAESGGRDPLRSGFRAIPRDVP